jgi:SAM-dependent methyltransferase
MPRADEIGKAYEHYYTHDAATARLARRSASSIFQAIWRLSRIGRDRDRLQLMWLHDHPPGRLLDVGCGDGRRLGALRARGWQVEGQEIDRDAARSARASGFVVHVGSLPVLGLPDRHYDAITLNHVVEHLHDPVATLHECRRLLRIGGLLVVITPNARSLGHEVFGPAWRGLEPPRHLQVFTPGALARVARDAGFTQVGVETTGANAYTFGAASTAIEGLRRGRPTGFVVSRLRALSFQIRESLSVAANPDRGEECLLRASP